MSIKNTLKKYLDIPTYEAHEVFIEKQKYELKGVLKEHRDSIADNETLILKESIKLFDEWIKSVFEYDLSTAQRAVFDIDTCWRRQNTQGKYHLQQFIKSYIVKDIRERHLQLLKDSKDELNEIINQESLVDTIISRINNKQLKVNC